MCVNGKILIPLTETKRKLKNLKRKLIHLAISISFVLYLTLIQHVCRFWWAIWGVSVRVCLVIVKLLPEHSVLVNTQFINNCNCDLMLVV